MKRHSNEKHYLILGQIPLNASTEVPKSSEEPEIIPDVLSENQRSEIEKREKRIAHGGLVDWIFLGCLIWNRAPARQHKCFHIGAWSRSRPVALRGSTVQE